MSRGARSLEGKVVLVTGATDGIGKAAARAFAERCATLVLVGRDAAKAEAVATELTTATGHDRIETLVADLSRTSDVRALAAAFQARHERLDVLVANAGAVFTQKTMTVDGFEATFALNHLAPFLLGHELMPVLRRTAGARVIVTASGSHRRGRLRDLDEVARCTRRYSAHRAYADSKLANVLFTRELARRGVTAMCFHPGFVATGFGQKGTGALVKALFRVVMRLFARSVEKGAETLVWLATIDDPAPLSGGYFHDRRRARPSQSPSMLLAAVLVVLAAKLGDVVAPHLHARASSVELGLGVVVASIAVKGLPLDWVRDASDLAARLWAFSERACGIATSGDATSPATRAP